ncbi:MAG: hypothetical protein JJ900_16090 [Rhodospirillales bacterium]|nr:hypothetical protein [Rhodospirillales bacterium]MBO6788369.1 hypothetical protein [Rhodospirillales bacterium]
MNATQNQKPDRPWKGILTALFIGVFGFGLVAQPTLAAADGPHWKKERHWKGAKHHRGHPGKGHWKHHGHPGKGHWKHHRHVTHRTVTHHRVYRDDDTHVAMDNATGGRLIGTILGAVVGTQVGKGKGKAAAVIGGGLLGFILGGEIGKSMDAADEAQTQKALERARTGQTITWSNPNSGATYNVTPTATYSTGAGQPCREYTTWVFIGGYEQEAKGTACRMPDGSWKPVATHNAGVDWERG